MINLVKRQQSYPHTSPVSWAVCSPPVYALYLDLHQCHHTVASISCTPIFQNLPCCPVYGFKSFQLFPHISVEHAFAVISWKSAFFHSELFVNNSTHSVYISFQWYCRIYLIHMKPTIYELRGDNVNTVRHSACELLSENMSQEKQDRWQTQVPQSESVTGCLSWCHYLVALTVTMWPSVLKYPFILHNIMLPSQGKHFLWGLPEGRGKLGGSLAALPSLTWNFHGL